MQPLTDNQKVTFSISPKDAKGNPAAVDGVPVWTNSNPLVGTLTPAADGLSAEFVASIPGTTTVAAKADADLGAGVTDLAATADVTVVPGAAVTMDLTAGDPSDQ
jgi:hypothetical protein